MYVKRQGIEYGFVSTGMSDEMRKAIVDMMLRGLRPVPEDDVFWIVLYLADLLLDFNIDDSEYYTSEYGSRIYRFMNPTGREVYFEATEIERGKYSISLLVDKGEPGPDWAELIGLKESE